MERAFGLEIPQTLEEICHPKNMALLVYDMQVGIMNQLPKEKTQRITNNILKILQAARQGGFRVFFCRHLSLPKEAAGVFQLRQKYYKGFEAFIWLLYLRRGVLVYFTSKQSYF